MRKAVAAILFGGIALVVLHDWLGIGGSGLDLAINGIVYDTVIVCAGLACLTRALRGGPERGAWIAIGASILAWGAGEIWWTIYIEGDPTPPYPSPADIGYIGFYPLAILGLYLLVRARAAELDRRLWMDGVIAALGTGALGAALVFEFVADRASGSTAEVVTTLAYPFGDVLLISLVVGVIALTRWRPGRTWTLLLGGLAAMAAADVAFTLQGYGTLPGGDWVEPIYLLSAVLLGAEAWQPDADRILPDARFDGWRELVVPGIVAVAMIGLVVIQYSNNRESALTTVLWATTMLAVIGRLAVSLRDNQQLLEQVRTDRLTGLGSQARLQMELERREREPGRPMTVILLDLNGFKRYNDTFGHPAGDKMLSLLGRRLGAAVGSSGTAYRLGGDEFLVLAEGGLVKLGEERDRLASGAAEALTSRGRGFELSAAWGVASIPEEADSPADAMRLADVRMYAQKESRRLAGSIDALQGEPVEQQH